MAGKSGLDNLTWGVDRKGRITFNDGETETQVAGPAYVTVEERIERQQAQRKADAEARRVQREEENTAKVHDAYVGFIERKGRPGANAILEQVADYSQTLPPAEQTKFERDPAAISLMYDRIEAGEDPFAPAAPQPSAQVYEDFRREHGLEPDEPQVPQGPDIEGLRERIGEGDRNAEVELASTIDLTYKGVE